MREWPPNSVTLTITTHSKLREALDGTDTQVATCVIDKWTAKMKRTEGYITREISWRKEGNSEDARKFYRWSIRRGEEEIILDRGPRTSFRQSSSPTIPPDRWRRSHKGPVLKPNSLPNSLYWVCWVWVCSHLQWKGPPKSGPYKYKFPLPHFVFHFIFHQSQLVMYLFFSILNFIYFIRKVKQIHNKS